MKTVNFTIELADDEEILRFEHWLKDLVNVKDLTILPDTRDLYDTDRKFRELCMKEKAARRYKNDYINKHNFKK